MSKRKDFYDSPLYTISNYIWYFFISNFYFILFSLPLILTIAAYKEKLLSDGFGFFLISLLFEGPAITALLSIMGKLIREKDISVTKDYLKAYKINFFQSLFLWTIQIGIIFLIIEDIKIIKNLKFGIFLIPIFYILLILILIIGFYLYPILSRFYLKTIDLIKLSIFYSIVKIKNSLFSIIIALAAILTTKFMGFLSIFLFGSIISFLVMYIQQDMLKELEEKRQKQNITV